MQIREVIILIRNSQPWKDGASHLRQAQSTYVAPIVWSTVVLRVISTQAEQQLQCAKR